MLCVPILQCGPFLWVTHRLGKLQQIKTPHLSFLQSEGPLLGKLSPRMLAAADTLGVLTEHMSPERLCGVRLYLTDEAMDPHREHQEALPANLSLLWTADDTWEYFCHCMVLTTCES